MTRRRAAVLIRRMPDYRRDAFVSGLQKFGFEISDAPVMKPETGDILVTWNRYDHYDSLAKRYEAAGATVIVVENGYIGADAAGLQPYAIAVGHHNGCGTWKIGLEDRWAGFDIELRPWRRRGDNILVLPQRGIGPPGVAMPRDWPIWIKHRLEKRTGRPIVIRPHPGKNQTPLEPDLENAWAVVTWGSGAAIKALAAGIPVFHELAGWIGQKASIRGIDDLESPFLGDRLPMFRDLAWAQWRLDEIARGEPFRWLMS